MMHHIICWLALLTLLSGAAFGIEFFEASVGLDTTCEFEGGNTELELGDVNGDGFPDIVSIGDHGSPYELQGGVMVWFGSAMRQWSYFHTGHFGFGGVALGDLDSDGLLDVAYAMHHNYSATDFGDQLIEAALGDGTGQDWTPWDDGLASTGETWGMFGIDVADVDNDGDLDIGSASFGYQNGTKIYLNQSDGTWQNSFTTSAGNVGYDFHFGDINRDGNADFVVSSAIGTVFFGDGLGTFIPADGNLPTPGGMNRYGVSLGDVDGDGGQDLAFVHWNQVVNRLQVWRYDALDSVWEDLSVGLPTGNYRATRLCDMNDDGFADLVAARTGGDIRVFLRDTSGNGGWIADAMIPIPSLYIVSALQAGTDLDHNGFADIVVLSEQGTWPSTQNFLHCFVESSVPLKPFVVPVDPGPGAVWKGGSAHTVRWHSATIDGLPQGIRLELSVLGSDGPWMPITENAVDNGAFQIQAPDSVTSADCFLRYTGTAQAISRGSFEIRATNNAPYLVADVDTLNFGRVEIGHDSVRAACIVNLGGAALQALVQQLTHPAFHCEQNCDSFEVAPHGEQTIVLRFAPLQAGLAAGTLVLEGGGRTVRVSLRGEGGTSDIGPSAQLTPTDVGLQPVYPNPFNGQFRVTYRLSSPDEVRLSVCNLLGQTVVELERGWQPAGVHTRTVNADAWPSGLYFVVLEHDGLSQFEKACLIR